MLKWNAKQERKKKVFCQSFDTSALALQNSWLTTFADKMKLAKQRLNSAFACKFRSSNQVEIYKLNSVMEEKYRKIRMRSLNFIFYRGNILNNEFETWF